MSAQRAKNKREQSAAPGVYRAARAHQMSTGVL
jgi:hypothetical protein